jgi:hypothetical protein
MFKFKLNLLKIKRKINNSKLKYLILIVFFLFSYILFEHIRFYSHQIPRSAFLDQLNKLKLHETIYFYSKCYCQKEIAQVEKVNDNIYKIIILDLNGTVFNSYFIDAGKFESSVFTCNLYNVLRRGPNQRIFSVTYDFDKSKNNQTYYDDLFFSQIEDKMKFIYKNYPIWNLRVYYYGSAISQSNICKKQCLLLELDHIIKYDNVDFCDASNLPYNLKFKWDFSYLSSNILGWLPIGDDFVDEFLSMDFNYELKNYAELTFFNKWISKSTFPFLFHRHNRSSYIWGFSHKRDSSKKAKKIFNIIVDIYLSGWYANKAKTNLFNDFILPIFS